MKRWVTVLAIVLAGTGCSRRFTPYLVEGPLSQQVPVVEITGVAGGISRGGGKLRASLPNGGTCTGRWAASGRSESITTTSGGLLGTYGSGYFTGTSITVDPRAIRCAGVLTCSDGRIMDMDFLAAPGAHGFGLARDNQGNLYRLIF